MNLEEVTQEKKIAIERINSVSSLDDLEELRVLYLGKKGILSSYMKHLSTLGDQEKKEFGFFINQVKDEVVSVIGLRKELLEAQQLQILLENEKCDLTLPERPSYIGRVHPISQAIDEITAIFASMGFQTIDGPEIEDDFHNFSALNISDMHPARQMHDTFYLRNKIDEKSMLLRTHTSTMQVRHMENNKPPYRVIAPGRTYRCDWDMTHTPMFHQVEGLLIDRNINMTHLKGCIVDFIKLFFELDDVPIRFRSSYFPFTEPSAEVDIGCSWRGKELVIGGKSDWLEILGCGMVHPNVLRNVGVNPDEYQGFAFGMGIERLAMLKYGIGDLRTFFESDLRWLNHYGFAPFDIPSLIGGLSR